MRTDPAYTNPASGTALCEDAIRQTLLQACEGDGFRVLRRGRHWILARRVPALFDEDEVVLECLRLTPLDSQEYGLSIRRHDGRWTRVPVAGNLAKLSLFVQRYLHHWIEA